MKRYDHAGRDITDLPGLWDDMNDLVGIEDYQRIRSWVDDLQSGMYINCVYCGHRYGPDDEVPATMAEVLKLHVEQCPLHPMSELKRENERLRAELAARAELHKAEIIQERFYSACSDERIVKLLDDIRRLQAEAGGK